ncbi:MAG: hypothetical protein VX663_02070, partial [Pseudomonadota bacterium]|nr:hypothetical protein [Pseudomonadota bacterium]
MLKGGAQHLLRWLLLAALYAAAGALTLPIPPLDNPVVPLWLPSGIGIAAVLGFGPVLLPGLVLGELVLRTLFSSPFWFTAGNILAVLAEALLVLWVARRLFRPGLPDLRDNLPAEALLLAALLVS